MRRKKTYTTVAVVVILLLALFGGYKYFSGSDKEKNAASAEITEVKRMQIKSVVSATGTIRPVDSVEVSSKITARIKSVLVKENDKVKAGQTVAVLDGKDYEASNDQAAFKVVNAKSKYDRVAYLNSIGAKSQEELEDARYTYDAAASSLEKTQSDLSETIITAPMDGVVVGEPKSAGTMAVQGNSNPTVILTIADMSKKQILAKVDETDIGSVKVGQNATFTVDTYTGKTFTARVSKISQTDVTNSWNTNSSSSSSSSTSASVVYYYVVLDVDDPENLLLPAMTARVDIVTSEKDSALVVPISALKTDTKGSYVILNLPDGTKENRYVSTGIYSDEYVEIESGLTDGDKVVITYKAKSSTAANSSGQKRGGMGRPPM
ncbi:MAG: efflux RND transporter periplasmic adaptor subunit [Anaerovibrio sp.]|uniref:efflux RND transporter periplasmic adaptor subunit n=1 Tax=Anaerovibrio sp. TaxID=1872532 RepID=UPI0025B9975C|nr:efflux RND transporter periplasmic adaptor subunit [Anaerovibrio sp.]MBE6098578.1 efflux RND transporter periplasmic adaptor subunit [Anaerovibrio sp.]